MGFLGKVCFFPEISPRILWFGALINLSTVQSFLFEFLLSAIYSTIKATLNGYDSTKLIGTF